MNYIRYLAAGLLSLTGIIHMAQLAMVELDATLAITILFGIAYLVIAFFLFSAASKMTYYCGAIVPLVGLLLATAGMVMNPTLLAAFFIVIDVIVVLCCFYLIFKSKQSA
jgi:hypothetical protein